MSKETKETKEYEVGYGKPPKASRYEPGQSGNPKGRPRGTKNLKTDLSDELNERIRITEAGQSRTISKQRALLKSLTTRALQGDSRAADTLLRLCERLLQQSDTGSETAPLTVDDRTILDRYVARKQAASATSETINESKRTCSPAQSGGSHEHK
jgi:hypothetical protein